MRMTGDHDDAHDVVQATFVKAYQSLDSFDTEKKFFSWIYRIAIHESIDLIRRKKRQALLSDEHPDDSESPEDQYVKTERDQKLQDALMDMEDSARTLMVLRYFADLSYSELGFVFEVPESRIKSRLYDARRSLTKHLNRHGLASS